MRDSSKTASRSHPKANISFPHGNADGKALTFGVAGVDDGELGAGGELSHGGAHTHVRHTAEYTRTGWMLMLMLMLMLMFGTQW